MSLELHQQSEQMQDKLAKELFKGKLSEIGLEIANEKIRTMGHELELMSHEVNALTALVNFDKSSDGHEEASDYEQLLAKEQILHSVHDHLGIAFEDDIFEKISQLQQDSSDLAREQAKGEITVTYFKNKPVRISRQDDEGIILSVIWEKS